MSLKNILYWNQFTTKLNENINFKNGNFSKMSPNGNYKAIGWATKMPVETASGGLDYEFIYECDEELTSEVKEKLMDFVFNSTNCNHCGSRMKNIIIVKDIDNDNLHIVGSKCGDGIQSFGKSESRLNGQTIRSAKISKGITDMRTILDANVGLEDALKIKNKIIIDIRENFLKYKTLSPKQIELVFKLAEKQKEYDVLKSDITPIDFTKISNIKLEVVSTKVTETNFGKVIKVLLKSPEFGWKLYGNIGSDIDKGTMVEFSSNNITTSPDDKAFGFFKRGSFKVLEIPKTIPKETSKEIQKTINLDLKVTSIESEKLRKANIQLPEKRIVNGCEFELNDSLIANIARTSYKTNNTNKKTYKGITYYYYFAINLDGTVSTECFVTGKNVTPAKIFDTEGEMLNYIDSLS